MALDPQKLQRLGTSCDSLSKRMDAAAGKGTTYPGHGRPDSHVPPVAQPPEPTSSSKALDMPAPRIGEPLGGRPDSDFSKLKGQLAHTKGVTSPGGLAAAIGRKELGQKEMTRRSVEGRKDSLPTLDQLRHNEIQLRQQLKDLDEQQIAIVGERKAVNTALARVLSQIQVLSSQGHNPK